MLKYLAMSCNVFPSQIPQSLPSSNCSNSRLPQSSKSSRAHWASSTAKGRELQTAADTASSAPVLRPVPDLFTLAQADLESTLCFSTAHSHDSRLQACLHCCLQKPTDRSQSWEDSSQDHFFNKEIGWDWNQSLADQCVPKAALKYLTLRQAVSTRSSLDHSQMGRGLAWKPQPS